MLDKINSRLSIGARLALIALLFAAASGFVTYMFARSALDDIAFSAKEGEGARYLNEVWNSLRSGSPFDANVARDSFAAGELATKLSGAQSRDERVAAGLALITGIADGSNLTLDPELDSFYVMDAVTVRLPALLDAELNLERAILAAGSPEQSKVLVDLATDRLGSASRAAIASLEAAMRNNASGETRSALAQVSTSLRDATETFIARVKSGSAAEADYAGYASVIDTTWRAANAELTRLLDTRVASLQSILAVNAIAIFVLLAAAFVLAWVISKGLRRRLGALGATMDQLRAGAFEVEVPYVGDGHETGQIAETLLYLRDQVAEKSRQDARRLADAETGSDSLLSAISRSSEVIEFSVDGRILSANDKTLAVLGYTAAEFVGQPASRFVSERHADSPEYRNVWNVLSRGDSVVSTTFYRHKNGEIVQLLTEYNPVVNAAGTTTKILALATDVTEQQRMAMDVAFKAAASDASSSAIMMVDRDFKVTYVNDATIALLRRHEELFRKLWPSFKPDAILGMNIDTFHKNPSHQRQMLSDPARLPFKTDITIGEVKIELNVNAIFDSQRKYIGNVLTWEDVTAARSNAGVLSALDRSKALIEFTIDGRILNANENFCRSVGYALEEIRGKHHSMFVDQAYRQSAEYRQFWEKLGRGEYDAGKYLRIGRDGRRVWLDATYNPIVDATGKAFKVVKLADDITQMEETRRAMEAERVRQAAEQASVVTALAASLNLLADGDLTTRISEPFAGDYDRLRVDFNTAMERLQDAMRTIVVNAGGIQAGSREISQASDDLSRRTEQQAASLEETAAALDEITATVKKTAIGAKQANEVVAATHDAAESSGRVVRETVMAMDEIEKSSKQISQIIGVIDEIAFQTNLLALNAGVEAARAGDAGRGFAVVASEVRALAQRSSGAAKEIKTLISESSRHVESGVKLVGDSGKVLKLIVDKVSEISGLVAEISASAQEQSTALSEVNTAVNQMDQTTQQNAAMVEQSTAASHSLTQEAQALMALVARFKSGVDLAEGHDAAAARSSLPPRAKSRVEPVHEQRKRIAQFATAGSTALKSDGGDWQEF